MLYGIREATPLILIFFLGGAGEDPSSSVDFRVPFARPREETTAGDSTASVDRQHWKRGFEEQGGHYI